jgi:hypothetical protein
MNIPRNSSCDDGILCTVDVCSSIGCINLEDDSWCPIHDKCQEYVCNPPSGDSNGCVATPLVRHIYLTTIHFLF